MNLYKVIKKIEFERIVTASSEEEAAELCKYLSQDWKLVKTSYISSFMETVL
jgi:hypothetical protein